MDKFLITGGAGFIGSQFTQQLRQKNPDAHITVLDKLTYAGNKNRLAEHSCEFIQGDILDEALLSSLFQQRRFDTVVHFAAETHVDRSLTAPFLFYKTNVQGTMSLLQATKNDWGDALKNKRFLHISTDEVYGPRADKQPLFTENSPLWPRNPYAASKAAADVLVLSLRESAGFPVTVTRSANNYGPGQHPEKLVAKALSLMLKGEAVPVYGDGTQQREWLHVTDHAAALLEILALEAPGPVYNIAGTNTVTNRTLVVHLASAAKEFLPQPLEIDWVADRPGHDRQYGMDDNLLRRETGWKPNVTLWKGLRQLVKESIRPKTGKSDIFK